MVKIVCTSDLHNQYGNVSIPECDILIIAGDYSSRGTIKEVYDFHTWLNKQPAKYKISMQGNHEIGVEKDFYTSKSIAESCCPNVYFIDEGQIVIYGINIWCSAITPWFHDWAWNKHRGTEINRHWKLIPEDTDILVTHGPPAEILDKTRFGESVGCWDLQCHVLYRVRPRMWVGGHIHEAYGHCIQEDIHFVNASICDINYKPNNKPFVVEFDEINKNIISVV